MRLGLGLGVDSITSQKIGAGFTGILDEYSGAVAAYSVRRMSGSYSGSALRVRRSSDDDEQDIGFDANGDLDTTALLAFVGTGGTDNGFVTKIYNQSGTGGTGRDLVQGTESRQAKIVNAGTLLTEGGKPCIKANIISSIVYGTYELGTAYEIPQPSFSIFSVLAHGSTQTTYVISGSTISSDRFFQSSGRLRYTINGSGNYDIYQTIDRTRVVDMYMNDGTLTFHQNNSEVGSVDTSASNGNSFEFKRLGSGGNNNNPEEFQELIIFPEDKDTQRGDIRDNINTYFSVY